VNNELERTWKKAVYTNYDTIPEFAWSQRKKSSIGIVGVSDEIRTGHFPNGK
jgi:hypothetical protein